MILLTDAAAEHVKTLMSQHGLNGYGLRLAISAGGCSGYQYLLDLVEGEEPGDRVFESNGVRVICDPKSYLILDGLEVDYESSLLGGGFKFRNPNATRSCGCGTSFTCN